MAEGVLARQVRLLLGDEEMDRLCSEMETFHEAIEELHALVQLPPPRHDALYWLIEACGAEVRLSEGIDRACTTTGMRNCTLIAALHEPCMHADDDIGEWLQSFRLYRAGGDPDEEF